MKPRFTLWLMVLALALILFLGACGDDDDDDADSSDDDSSSDDDDNDTADDDDNDTTDDDDTGDDDDTEPGDFTATLEDNPICVLSCVITWTTDEPATSWVKFGEESGDFTHRIGNDDLVTDHEVIVVGMYEGETYNLKAFSETADKAESSSQAMSFTAGDLPYSWMAGEMDVYDESQAQDGWTITNLAGGSIATSVSMAIYDMSGEIIWYYLYPGGSGRMDNVISLLDGNQILVGPGVPQGVKLFAMDLKGDVTWEGPTQPGTGMDEDGSLHHVFYQIADGQYAVSKADVRGGIIGDEIQVFDSELNYDWTWNFWDHLSPTDPAPGGSWTHVNSVSFDLDHDYCYISSYTLGCIFKVDMTTDQIEWVLGQGEDFDSVGSSDYPWFTGSHGLDYLGDDKFIFYDNGNIYRQFSRAVIYELDETNMEADIIWEYRGDDANDQFYNATVGDADLLDNGNVLITAGNGAQNQSKSRFMEITPDGEKVWQMWLYNQPDKRVASFQANRIPRLAEVLD